MGTLAGQQTLGSSQVSTFSVLGVQPWTTMPSFYMATSGDPNPSLLACVETILLMELCPPSLELVLNDEQCASSFKSIEFFWDS